MIEELFFDTADQPVNNDKGAHRITYEHDRFGNVTKTRLYDAAGREVVAQRRPARPGRSVSARVPPPPGG
jgi:hypothetical protein